MGSRSWVRSLAGTANRMGPPDAPLPTCSGDWPVRRSGRRSSAWRKASVPRIRMPPASTMTSMPTCGPLGLAPPTSPPVWSPAVMVVNGSLSKTAVNGGAGARTAALGPGRGGHDHRDPDVPHQLVRAAPGGDTGGRGHRGGPGAGGRPLAAATLSIVCRSRWCVSMGSSPVPTSWPPSRRCSGSSFSTHCRACSSVSASRSSCCCIGRTGRTSRRWAWLPGSDSASTATSRAIPRTTP